MIKLPTYYQRTRTCYYPEGISLHQICKNEIHNIPGFFECVKDMGIEEWIVIDTGSTDGSIELLQQLGARVEPFSNTNKDPRHLFDEFGPARNEALQFCNRRWVLWADFDDRFPKDFRHNLNDMMAMGIDCYDFSVKYGTSLFPHMRIWRNGMGVTWMNPIHEVPCVDGLTRHYSLRSFTEHLIQDKDNTRLPRNLFACRKHALKHPDDPRTWFYLGNAAREASTIDKLYRYEAIRSYERYLELRQPSDFPDEVCMARFFLGHLYYQEGQLDEAESCAWGGIEAKETYGESYLLMRDVKRAKGDQDGFRRWNRIHKCIDRPKAAALFITDQFYNRQDLAFWRPGSLGDLLMATPALMEAKRLKLNTIFYTSNACAPILFNHPWVDELEVIGGEARPPDGVVCPSYPVQEGYPESSKKGTEMMMHGKYFDCPMHLCQHFAQSCGLPVPKTFKIECPILLPGEQQLALDLLTKEGPYVTLQTETGWSVNKEWFDDRWAIVVKYLIDKGIKVVQIGMKNQLIPGAIDMIKKTPTVRHVLGVLKHAQAHIGLDSVTNHAANGYDLPSVILFGSTSSHSSGYSNAINLCHTRQGTGQIMCGPCWREMEDVCPHRACMQSISVDEAIAAIDEKVVKTFNG